MSHGEIAYRTREVTVMWAGASRRLTILPAGNKVNGKYLSFAMLRCGAPSWTFDGDDAEAALMVLGVAWMRGGEAGLTTALRGLLNPRSTFAEGIYAAEVGAWSRNGGRAGAAMVRQMEA